MNTPKISVIIPVYNAKKYLCYCIKSILNQTYDNFELILVDDGSTDGSGSICDSFKEQDNRVNVIHKKNEGVCSARNSGIINSKGEYIAFCDDDDWMPNNSLQIMYDIAKNNSADLVCGSIELIWPLFNSKELNKNLIFEKKVDNEALCLLNNIGSSIWGRLFKTKVIKDNNILFPKEKTREDSIFFYNYLINCKKVATCDNIVYFYNKLEVDTGCSKYHKEYGECSLINLFVRNKAISSWSKTAKDDEILYKENGNYQLIDVINNYLLSDVSNQEKKHAIKDSYLKFVNYIDLYEIDNQSVEVLGFKIANMLVNEEYDKIICYFNAKKNSIFNNLKKKINVFFHNIKSLKYRKR